MKKEHDLQTIILPIKQLKLATYNPRKITKKELEKLKHSINEFGFIQPVLVNSDNTVIAGHQRIKAARELKYSELPVIKIKVAKEKEKALNIALNKIGGSFEPNLLAELLADLKQQNLESLTGFDETELKKVFWQQNNKINRSLIEDYIIPPFSIFDAKQGYWQKRKKEWLDMIGDSGQGRDEDLIGGLNNIASIAGSGITGTSIFDPVLTEVLYTWFIKKGGLIIDPFSGGITRGVVASMLGYKYIGTDLSEKQVTENKKIAKHLKETGAEWHTADGVKLEDYVKQPADGLFTCPPYYNLEKYSTDQRDLSAKKTYQEFLKAYREILARTYNLLKKDAWAIIVVGNIRDTDGNYYNLVGDTINTMQDAGYKFYNEIILATAIGTATVRARRTFENKKVVKTHQNILFFKRGQEATINGELRELLLEGRTATAHHDILVFKK